MLEILSLVLLGGIVYDHHTRMKTLRNEIKNYGKQTA